MPHRTIIIQMSMREIPDRRDDAAHSVEYEFKSFLHLMSAAPILIKECLEAQIFKTLLNINL